MIRKNKTALQAAAGILARQDQSSKKLRQKLIAKKYNETEIDAALDKLTKKNFLNDAETCANQFENLYEAENLSVRQIYFKLLQRGFESDTIKNLIPGDTREHEINAAAKAVAKKFSGVEIDAKTKTKIWQYLSAKGFDSEIISEVANDFLRNNRN